MKRDMDEQPAVTEQLSSRLQLIMEEYDLENRLVTMIVELYDEGLLDLTCEKRESEMVLVIKPKTSDFEIVEITDPFEHEIARHFRDGRAVFVIRANGRAPLEWRAVNAPEIKSLVN